MRRSLLLRYVTTPSGAGGGGATTTRPSPPDGGTQDGDEDKDQSPSGGFRPISSQEDLDRVIGEYLARERARYSDYDEVKAKAKQFDADQEARKTEEQKAADRLTALEARAAAAEARAAEAEAAAVRAQVAAARGVPEAFLTASDKGAAEKQADALLEWRDGPRDRGQATSPLGPGARSPRANGSTSSATRGGGVEAGRAWFTDRFAPRPRKD